MRAGRAYRQFSGIFVVLLTVAIGLFVVSLLAHPRYHWPLWIAAAAVISLTAPLRTWGLRRGLLSYYVHGAAVEGTVTAVEPAGEGTWRVRYRFEAGGAGIVEAETLVYDAPRAPLAVGEAVPVLHRPGNPRDSVLPVLAGILPGDGPDPDTVS
ncbi:MAG: DUF3592 domain-containing protein [Planctomycetaceae bacterium]|nr:DUF3592 domain-containing protein [Planctomycetota bacterium]NUN51436.1 DUF3592 domain-containing protein [Planctomycetaceae bacterium]